jgi:hypothetical protein
LLRSLEVPGAGLNTEAIPTEVWRGFPHSLQANFGGSFLFASISRERRRRMLENRALRRIFGRKKDEVRGGWRKSHDEKLHN